jgi:hypothetical protein
MKEKRKKIENFQDCSLELQKIVTGGEHLCTTYASEDGAKTGDDIYDTDACAVVYLN